MHQLRAEICTHIQSLIQMSQLSTSDSYSLNAYWAFKSVETMIIDWFVTK